MSCPYRLILFLFLTVLPFSLFSEITVENKDGRSRLSVSVTPGQGEIRFDREFQARGTWELSPFNTGTFLLEFRLAGHKSESIWITLEADRIHTVKAALEPLTGVLDLSGLPVKTRVYLNNRIIAPPGTELKAGFYTLKILRFGFEPVINRVEILPGKTAFPNPDFLPAKPEILNLRLSRRSISFREYNKEEPLKAAFTVSAPSRGIVEIRNNSEVLVRRLVLPDFTRERQEFSWDGRDDRGEILPDGNYSLGLILASLKGETVSSAVRNFRIDSSADNRGRSFFSGSSGLMLVPQARPLARGAFQIGTLALIHPDFRSSGDDSSIMVLQAGARVSPVQKLEISALGAVAASQGTAAAGTGLRGVLTALSLSGRYLLTRTDNRVFQLASQLRGSLQFSSTVDYFTNYPGVSLALPMEFSLPAWGGFFRFLLTPEIHASGTRIESSAAGDPEEGAFIRLYGRTGLLWENHRISAGISMALRTSPVLENDRFLSPGLEFPLETAGEFHFHLPKTDIDLSALVLMKSGGGELPELSAGLGVNLLY